MEAGDAPAHASSLRDLPSVEQLASRLDAPHALAVPAARAAIAAARDALRAGEEVDVLAAAREHLDAAERPTLRRVLNATGVIVHTNLGRAPLPAAAREAAAAAGTGYSTLEYDLERGARGSRQAHVAQLLRELTGAEAALAVNNNAGALLLALNALAAGRETLVSRGELIEIGGAFRLPDIMQRAGTILREVGTTNRTHLRDFADAIGPQTALILKVHTSNYEIRVFTASVPPARLAALAHERGLPFVEDLGSGTVVDLDRWGLPHEPTVAESLHAGADLVTFSGDKLLGGPQAGLVVGSADLIAALAKNPLKRALRLDKIRLAALEAVLRLYADPDRLAARLPALRLLTRTRDEIAASAGRLCSSVARALDGVASAAIVETSSQIGSGALPVDLLPSAALVLTPSAKARGAGAALKKLEQRLRDLPIPVLGRINDGALWLDLRCLEDEAEFLAQLGNEGRGTGD